MQMQAFIRDVKALLTKMSSTPVNLQRLVFRGHILKDEQRLTNYSGFN